MAHSDSTPFKLTLPRDPAKFKVWKRTTLDPWLAAEKADSLNTIGYPRTGCALGAPDNAAYTAGSKYHANGGANDAERAQHKMFLLDQAKGAKFKLAVESTIYESCCSHPDDENRLTALVERCELKYPVDPETAMDEYRSMVVPTAGAEASLITWDTSIGSREQAPAYINKIDLAVQRHELVQGHGDKPITDEHKTDRVLFANPETGRRTGILPERFSDAWVDANLRQHKADWPRVCREIVAFDQKRPNIPGADIPGSVFTASGGNEQRGTKRGAPPRGKKAASKDDPCWHYHNHDDGCGFSDADCKWKHDGKGKLNQKKIDRFAKQKSKPKGKGMKSQLRLARLG